MQTISKSLVQHFRCPEECAAFDTPEQVSAESGYFRFDELTCYGRTSTGYRTATGDDNVCNITARAHDGTVSLPFLPDEVVDNLRREHYAAASRPSIARKGVRRLMNSFYYAVRPWMPVRVRKHLQRLYRRGSRNVAFPCWPNDTTVDDLMARLLALTVRHSGQRVPFIWFWPNGATAAMTITHDVENQAGYDLCRDVMNLDERFGFCSSFQIVPEQRYKPTVDFLNELKSAGFELNIHDLNHDGHLFRDWRTFSARVPHIRRYAGEFGARGFRSAIMYRNPDWLPLLGFEYDMSVPNAAHLDPQSGGCCTLFPFFIGNTLELPLTTIQDYSLLHLLNCRSIELWQQQTELIVRKHGLATFLVHPDYIVRQQDRAVYVHLLEYLKHVREDLNVWAVRPQEVNDWWRARAAMHLVHRDDRWYIEGPQSERARLAFADVRDGRLTFELSGDAAKAAETPALDQAIS